MNPTYPSGPGARTDWIVRHRGPRDRVDPWQPARSLLERERAEDGRIASVTTLFLTNRECPWRCLMCDLWRHTLVDATPSGAVPAQIAQALQDLPATDQLKLYNSGSFFDPQAVPPEDWPSIVPHTRPFNRLVVECHPALIGDAALRFRDQLNSGTRFEIALGLETTHPEVLEKLNKRMSLELFARAARFLRANGIALRAFVLLRPPFLTEAEGVEWALRSTRFAQECGASVVTLIPTRAGNGALETLAQAGQFAPPKLASLEQALSLAIPTANSRVFGDLWDLAPFAECPFCYPDRHQRLEQMNLQQIVPPSISCAMCGAA